ncbi:hypothetical protein H7849_11900 [Alloacidobacterium dinghuense]|uniref:Major capsid protein n=1 Tax=Alloacidobacterium dinghuense TaxID=2763107 RepID=A0A7G8BPQ9_9BACT|nr:hypothetical protein [Alloacidobacterium dinghuense]QNI34529.1 hypothetical protein H7849_11900 [Alloacidobacterium dinghuense]
MGAFVPTMPAGTLNVALSNFAKEFRNNALVGERFAPRVPVARQSYQYVIWNRDNMRVPGSTLRAPGDKPGSVRRDYSTAPYMCQSHALDGSVPFESEAYGLGLGFSTKKQLTQQLIDVINLDREVRIANLLLNTTNFPNGVTLSGTSMWDAYPSTPETGTDGSHPIVVVDAYKAILRQAGIQDSQMCLLLSDPVFVKLRNHPDLIDRFKFTNPQGAISLNQLSSAFGVEVIVASAIQLDKGNNASWVWGNNALLAYTQAAPTMDDVSCAKTFVWAGGNDGQGGTIPGPMNTVDGYGVLEWIDPHQSAKKYWASVDWYYGLQVTAVETAIPILNAVAAPTMGAIPSDVEG